MLRELQALVSCPDDDGTEDVSDTEWFYLVSMAHSFAQGVGYVFLCPAAPFFFAPVRLLLNS